VYVPARAEGRALVLALALALFRVLAHSPLSTLARANARFAGIEALTVRRLRVNSWDAATGKLLADWSAPPNSQFQVRACAHTHTHTHTRARVRVGPRERGSRP
jgi:hypothetical protein